MATEDRGTFNPWVDTERVCLGESILEAMTGCWWLEFECYSYICCTGSVGQGVLAIYLFIYISC